MAVSFTGPVADRIAIRELHETYADASLRGDVEQRLGCFTEDCVCINPFGELRGKPALRAMWEQMFASLSALGFFPVLGAIEVDGDRATTRAHVREVLLSRSGSVMKLVGSYDDQLVRENGSWKFVRRAYSVLIREGDWTA